MPFVSFMEESKDEESNLIYAGLLPDVPYLGDLVLMPPSKLDRWVVISRTLILKDGSSSWLLIVGQGEC